MRCRDGWLPPRPRDGCSPRRWDGYLSLIHISATEVISAGPEGIILESVLEGYAEYYSADLSEKVIRGMTENALKGKFTGGAIPVSYTHLW